MGERSFCLINEIDGFDYLNCYLKRPICAKHIFKVMSQADFKQSKEKNYLYFNRVDSYPDKNDGLQLLLDEDGNKNSKFEKNPNHNLFEFYNQMRQSTYACCFSTVNNSKFRNNYGSSDLSGKVCLTFNLEKLISQLKKLTATTPTELNGCIYLSFGEINYLDWKNAQLNLTELQNNISYVFIKDINIYSHESEFRLALWANPMAIHTYANYKGLQLFFDFDQAQKEKVIEKIEEYK